jgi:flavin reductase (DIM6/NTAB) family NADH-FMN oxidoreductase RutF
VASGDELRALMRRVPAAVAVVTVDVDGERVGLTVGSLVSLSLEPSLVGVSVSKFAALHELLRRAGGFSASLLGSDQAALAQHFARGVPPIALWHGVAVRPLPGAPLLEGALGWLRCRLRSECEAGDHTIFVAEAVEVEHGPAVTPLLYLDGSYRAL